VTTAAIEVEHLVKRFGETVAVNDVSFTIAEGECVGLLGPNGAGKTTTLEILEGLQKPTSGSVRVLGRTWDKEETYLRDHLGIQLQETRFRDSLTVEEIIRTFRSFYTARMSVDDALSMVNLVPQRKTQAGQLSGGQRQRLGLAVSLVSDPEIIFLDEPTTGLDPHARRELWDLLSGLRKRGRTMLLTTHYMEEAATLCDRVIIVDRGRLVTQGSPRGLIAALDAAAIVELSAPGLPIDKLRQTAGVREVKELEGAVRLTVEKLHVSLPALMAVLQDSQVELTSMKTHEPSLDDVYVSLTGRPLDGDPGKAP
jgi:ABC-2 type transport system ATP-binding protein